MSYKKLPYGFLLTIEGIDGSGKSTFSKKLKKIFEKKGYHVVLTKEPGATKLGKHLRLLLGTNNFSLCPKTEYLLFAADRAQHIKDIVKPSLENGSIVISDRMADSSVAYQGYGRELSRDIIKKINQWTMNDIEPDLTIYLKINYETMLQRISNRKNISTFEQEHADFFRRVIKGFENLMNERNNILYIDASQSFESVKKEVIDKTLKFFLSKHK